MTPAEKKVRLLHFRAFIEHMLESRKVNTSRIEGIINYSTGIRKNILHTSLGINSCIKVVVEYYRAYERWCNINGYIIDEDITKTVMKMYN